MRREGGREVERRAIMRVVQGEVEMCGGAINI